MDIARGQAGYCRRVITSEHFKNLFPGVNVSRALLKKEKVGDLKNKVNIHEPNKDEIYNAFIKALGGLLTPKDRYHLKNRLDSDYENNPESIYMTLRNLFIKEEN